MLKNILLLLLLCFYQNILSQNKKIVTTDSLHNRVSYVLFYNTVENKEYNTDNNGELTIAIDSISNFFIYKEGYKGIQIDGINLMQNPTIQLSKDDNLLNEIVLRVNTKEDAGIKTYSLNQKMLNKNYSVSEVFQNIPMFFVKDLNIFYKGEEAIVIIDGQKSINGTKNIDPKNIDKIEVIPFGNSAYGTNGKPIINIITKKNLEDYFKEDINFRYIFNSESYNINSSTYFKKDRWLISLPITFSNHYSSEKNTTYLNQEKFSTNILANESASFHLQPEVIYQKNKDNQWRLASFFNKTEGINKTDYVYDLGNTEEYNRKIKFIQSITLLSFQKAINDNSTLYFSTTYNTLKNKNNGNFQYQDWKNDTSENSVLFNAIYKERKRTLFSIPFRYDIFYSYYYTELVNRLNDNIDNNRHKIGFNGVVNLSNQISLNVDLSYNLLNGKDHIVLNNSTFSYRKNDFTAYLNYYNQYYLISMDNISKENSIDTNLNISINNTSIHKSMAHNFTLDLEYSITDQLVASSKIGYEQHNDAPVNYLIKDKENSYLKTQVNAGKNQKRFAEIGLFYQITDRFLIQTYFNLNQYNFSLLNNVKKETEWGYKFYANYKMQKEWSISVTSDIKNYSLINFFEYKQNKTPYTAITINKEISKSNLLFSLSITNPFYKINEKYNARYSNSFENIDIVDTRSQSIYEQRSMNIISLWVKYTFGNNKIRSRMTMPIQTNY